MPDVPDDLDDLVRAKEIAKIAKISPRVLFDWSRRGLFPAPIRLSARVFRWSRREVERHLRASRLKPAEVSHAS